MKKCITIISIFTLILCCGFIPATHDGDDLVSKKEVLDWANDFQKFLDYEFNHFILEEVSRQCDAKFRVVATMSQVKTEE